MTSTYSGSMSIGEIFVFLVKLVIVFFPIVLCAIGAFVSVRFFGGAVGLSGFCRGFCTCLDSLQKLVITVVPPEAGINLSRDKRIANTL